jgi:Flp pilus assembly protein protease CpaA
MTVNSIALGVCALWAVAIAVMDLHTYRITNISLILGLLLVWPALRLIEEKFQFSLGVISFTVIASLAGLASLIGMGDVKLLLFLAPWLHYDNLRNPIFLLIALSWLQLTAELVLKRSFPQRIAFAPAILAAAALNMAT